jgi:parallel beta-helix repeat protein
MSIDLTVKVHKVEASGTIYIRANGLVEGTDKITSADNITYTFTENINDSIVVQRINITIDGDGYMLNGAGTGIYAGLTVEYVDFPANDNVTIQNVTIIGFGVGIGLISTEVNRIFECTITNNTYGIWGAETMNNTISGNTITNNSYGIYFNTAFFTDVYGNQYNK